MLALWNRYIFCLQNPQVCLKKKTNKKTRMLVLVVFCVMPKHNVVNECICVGISEIESHLN